MRRLILVGVAAALVLTACGGSGNSASSSATAGAKATVTALAATCSTQDGKKAYDLLNQVAQEWDDAYKLAGSTPRAQLADQIGHLQTVRRNLQNQAWPSCASQAQTLLVSAMDAGINGFISFLGEDTTPTVTSYFDDYSRIMSSFQLELAKIQ